MYLDDIILIVLAFVWFLWQTLACLFTFLRVNVFIV